MRLHVSNPGGGYTKLDERSDGLKVFVSLLAVTAAHEEEVPPVVLIDEIERHLHYDAQADLIQVFAHQTALPQIIYTTHSAGCLPEDIGNGVRMVGPLPHSNISEIHNHFWTMGEGFSPMLVGMGASTLAFVPVRNAVLTEGATDIILLPTLIRDAIGSKSLGYQIAPASSEAPAARIGGLDNEALNVAWLVDADEAGEALRTRLTTAGIPAARVVRLVTGKSTKVLEDLVPIGIYVDAVNEQFRRSGIDARIGAGHLRGNNRPKRLTDWCDEQGIPVPSKTAVAYTVLEFRRDGSGITNPGSVRTLSALHARLRSVFER